MKILRKDILNRMNFRKLKKDKEYGEVSRKLQFTALVWFSLHADKDFPHHLAKHYIRLPLLFQIAAAKYTAQ